VHAPAPPAAASLAGRAVSVRGLHKAYGPVKAVDGVSLDVAAGEFVALLGPSGSGKTTILMTIAGFETPDAGSIAIGGADVTALPPSRREIGMVFQRYALFPHMTVAENIAFPLKMRRITGAPARERVERALAMVRLEGYGGRRINQLSGGQQQRIALARALVYNPPLLLMDEPLGALDKHLREEMQIEIKHLQKRLGTTVIYVTHDQAEALTMADRIAVLHRGLVQQYASPEDIYERPENEFTAGFIGEINFIGGRLLRREGAWHFAIAGSPATVDLSATPARPDWRDGAAARLTIRPELIRILPAGSPAGLAGILDETIYGGGTLACVVTLTGGVRLTARIAAADRPAAGAGSPVTVAWPRERSQVFVQ
jgi:putative spermidine/putrescine transport system ATP-binding protein/mannopine transport system ATP-binding protein